MSTPIFPDFSGLAWEAKRSPTWNTIVQRSASGIESRMSLQTLPVREYELKFNYLKGGSGFQDYQRFEGFYNSCYGGSVSFFLRDQDDCSTTGEPIATGDGSTTVFQLVRARGGFTEPVQGIDTRSAAAYGPLGGALGTGAYTRPAAVTLAVYLNGTPTSAFTSNSDTAQITFTTAPASGVSITADFSYFWRVRFLEDQLDLQRLWYQVYELQTLKLRQVRV